MRQIFYFFIGVLISICLMLPFSYAACDYNPSDSSDWAIDSIYLGSCTSSNYQSDIYNLGATSGIYISHQTYIYASDGSGVYIAVAIVKKFPGDEQTYYAWFSDIQSNGNVCIPLPDSDGDNIPDGLDAYPNTDSAYQFRIMTNYFDAEGNCVAQLIVTSSGDYVLLGDLTAAEIEAGVSAGTYKSQFVNSQIWIDSSDLKEDSAKDIYSNGQSTKPVTSTKAAGLTGQASDGTKATTPTIQSAPTTGSQDGDSDSQSFKKIVDNSNSTNKNLENIAGYLGITNDYLAKLNNKTGSASSGGSAVTVNTPTADEIGQAVGDNLIDPGQTIDTTVTDNIPDLDETDTLTTIKTKYSDRYDLFITTLKGSDLFSLPFGIFTGPSGSGSSIQTVNIGKWGSSSEQTATIDYSDYDNVWQILRSVLLLVTSFACFKILVLKKG